MKETARRLCAYFIKFVDFFYPVVKKWLPVRTYRYLAAGAFNTFLGYAAYYISFKFLLNETTFDFGFYAFKGHVAALIISSLTSFFFGFILNKFVVFSESDISGRKQLFRYFIVSLFNLLLNYILIKILVEYFQVYPTIAQVVIIIFVTIFSYLAQRNYSFKITPPPAEKD